MRCHPLNTLSQSTSFLCSKWPPSHSDEEERCLQGPMRLGITRYHLALSASSLFFRHTRHVPTMGLCSGCVHPCRRLQTARAPEQAQLWARTRPMTPTCGSRTPNSPSTFEFWTKPHSLYYPLVNECECECYIFPVSPVSSTLCASS